MLSREEKTAREQLKEEMLKRYSKGAFTHTYAFGYVKNNIVYYSIVLDARPILKAVTKIEKRDKQMVIRFNPTKKQIAIIEQNAIITNPLFSFDFMEAEKMNHNNNRGDTFEDLVTIELNGKQPTNRAEKFTDCGDLVTPDGTHIQAKFGSSKGAATFTTEKTLFNLGL